MSHSSTSAVPPCPVMLVASSSSLSRLRAASATAAPWAASAVAVAAPIPLDAPVTSATVPFSTGSTRPTTLASQSMRPCGTRSYQVNENCLAYIDHMSTTAICRRLKAWCELYPDPSAGADRNAAARVVEDERLGRFAGLDVLDRAQV